MTTFQKQLMIEMANKWAMGIFYEVGSVTFRTAIAVLEEKNFSRSDLTNARFAAIITQVSKGNPGFLTFEEDD